jgi:hypothetical protein
MEGIFVYSLVGLIFWVCYYGVAYSRAFMKKDSAAKAAKLTRLKVGSAILGGVAMLSLLLVGISGSFEMHLKKKEAEERQRLADAAALEKEQEEERLRRDAEKAEDQRKGFHCLSGWDGSHPGLVKLIKENLRNPRSFEHIETRVSPKDDKGEHRALTEFRAENGFGGLDTGLASGVFSNANCAEVSLIEIID